MKKTNNLGNEIKLEEVKKDRVHLFDKPETEVSFEDWEKTINENFPDLLFPAEVALSVLSQILIKDVTNPSAVVFVDVPASGKTIMLNFFSDIPTLVYPTDKFTSKAFVSHAANVKKEELVNIDLLPRIQYKTLLIRDLATIFSKREDELIDSLGTLTRLLDGEGLSTDSGLYGQREYVGEYLFMFLAASTPFSNKVWRIMSTLGPRLFFLKMQTRNKSEEEQIRQLRSSPVREKEKICRRVTTNFLQTLWFKNREGINWDKNNDNKEYISIITKCGSLLSKLRARMEIKEDEFDNSYKYTSPLAEMPDRINQILYNISRGHAISCGRKEINKSDLRQIIELTLDSAQNSRSNLFKKIVEYGGSMKTSEVESEMKCSKTKAIQDMDILGILGLCSISQPVKGHVGEPEKEISILEEFKWILSDEIKEIRSPKIPVQTVENEVIIDKPVWRNNQ